MATLAENKDVVRQWVAAMNEHDLEAAVRLAADDLVNHAALPEAQGAAGLRRIFEIILAAFPDMRLTCEDLVAEGDRVVCRVAMEGTHTGALRMARFPIAATGRPVRTEQLHVFRVAGGKIVEHWAGRDDLGVLRQLGQLPFGQPGAAS